jgi:hypothetical protein
MEHFTPMCEPKGPHPGAAHPGKPARAARKARQRARRGARRQKKITEPSHEPTVHFSIKVIMPLTNNNPPPKTPPQVEILHCFLMLAQSRQEGEQGEQLWLVNPEEKLEAFLELVLEPAFEVRKK